MTSFADISDRLAEQAIELPSWAFGNSGTRFKVFAQPGVPRDPFEKVSDAAQVHQHTGLAPKVALHIPWDTVDSFADLAKHAQDEGVTLGTVNSNALRPAHPAEGDRPPLRVHRRHE
jgi:L-rhamnose isomerase/sugar isomerase